MWLLFYFICSTIVLFVGMWWGDCKDNGEFPWDRKKGVNSGAKFG